MPGQTVSPGQLELGSWVLLRLSLGSRDPLGFFWAAWGEGEGVVGLLWSQGPRRT